MEPSTPHQDLEHISPAVRLPADRARNLLRKLRDLDLHAPRLSLSGGRRVQVDGCLSLDSPVESSLRYLVKIQGEPDHVIEIAWHDGRILLEARVRDEESSERRLELPLVSDGNGHAILPAIQARVRPDSTDPREIEHFLRRLVRAALAQRRY